LFLHKVLQKGINPTSLTIITHPRQKILIVQGRKLGVIIIIFIVIFIAVFIVIFIAIFIAVLFVFFNDFSIALQKH
jgi:ABC-type polysaccharide/polyol phosphate export permease